MHYHYRYHYILPITQATLDHFLSCTHFHYAPTFEQLSWCAQFTSKSCWLKRTFSDWIKCSCNFLASPVIHTLQCTGSEFQTRVALRLASLFSGTPVGREKLVKKRRWTPLNIFPELWDCNVSLFTQLWDCRESSHSFCYWKPRVAEQITFGSA